MESFPLRKALDNVLETLTGSFADLVPRVLTAIVVIVIGLIIAKVVRKVLLTTFSRLRIDSMLERLGVTGLLEQVGYKASPSEGFVRVVYILLIVLFIQSGTQSVGLFAISNAIAAFFSYIPSLIAAFMILLLGSLVSRGGGRMVEQSATDAGIEYGPSLGRATSALILFIVLIMAITQLQIDTAVIRSVALVLLAGGSLAFALTFGLGTRGITRNVVAGFYIRKLIDVGEDVEIAGEKGTLVAVTPVKTLIQREDETVAISNQQFLEDVVRL